MPKHKVCSKEARRGRARINAKRALYGFDRHMSMVNRRLADTKTAGAAPGRARLSAGRVWYQLCLSANPVRWSSEPVVAYAARRLLPVRERAPAALPEAPVALRVPPLYQKFCYQ